jgi:hypothetical protein
MSAFGVKRTWCPIVSIISPLLTDPVEKGLVNIDES